ncbi:MAG: acyl transferase, partial [Flavobacteriaceae bacterium]|nr:acyl transferase [Muriicola sp.]NNL39835.1 acyl transferase [Flavobacteriaceae bacterium]
YSKGKGVFYSPPWMEVFIRDTEDPLSIMEAGRSGGVNIIDLANLYSCSFIATQDLGRLCPEGGFEILGRFDNADIRGCNLMFL